jgi:ribonuclease Z
MKIQILGSGSATPHIERHQTSLALSLENDVFLIDCGEGTQWRLLEFGIKITKINYIFISHLHSDHYLGLFGLLGTMQSLGRKNKLTLFAPFHLKEILLIQFKYQQTFMTYDIEFVDTNPEEKVQIFENNQLSIYSFPLKHRIPTCGFIFKEKEKPRNLKKEKISSKMLVEHIHLLKQGLDVFDEDGKILYKNEEFALPPLPKRSFAFCSDTIFDLSLVSYIEKVNLLYHEATFLSDKKDRAAETFHSTADQAAMIAKNANVEKLIIGHFSSRYKELEPFLLESLSVFPNTELALEGKEFVV